MDLVLRSTRVITPKGTRPTSIAVAAGKIAAVLPYDADAPAGARLQDVGDDVVPPGLVDTHVHVNDPGRTEWEGFWTATRAAAAGAVTTLLDMPLNSLPPTTTVADLVDIYPDGGISRLRVFGSLTERGTKPAGGAPPGTGSFAVILRPPAPGPAPRPPGRWRQTDVESPCDPAMSFWCERGLS